MYTKNLATDVKLGHAKFQPSTPKGTF